MQLFWMLLLILQISVADAGLIYPSVKLSLMAAGYEKITGCGVKIYRVIQAAVQVRIDPVSNIIY